MPPDPPSWAWSLRDLRAPLASLGSAGRAVRGPVLAALVAPQLVPNYQCGPSLKKFADPCTRSLYFPLQVPGGHNYFN